MTVVGDMTASGANFSRWGFLAHLDYEAWPVERVAEVLAGQGYNSVELTLAHFDPRRMSAAELSSAVADTRKAGLEVSEMVVQRDLVCADAAELADRVDLTIEVARAAVDNGVTLLNVLTGPCRWEAGHVDVGPAMPEGQAWSIMLDAFERMLDGVGKAGACVALEPCWGGLAHDYYSTLPVLERFRSHPAFGINLDPSHLVLHRNDVDWLVREWGPLIRHVHIKDVIGVPGADGDQFMFPMIGEGRVDWAEFFVALAAIQYRGYMSVEFESYKYYKTILKSDPAAASAVSIAQLRALEALMPAELLK